MTVVTKCKMCDRGHEGYVVESKHESQKESMWFNKM